MKARFMSAGSLRYIETKTQKRDNHFVVPPQPYPHRAVFYQFERSPGNMRTRKWYIPFIPGALVFLIQAACLTGASEPKPGASFHGSIDVSGAASSGSLSFTISERGEAILDLSISLQQADCQGMITMGSVSDYFSNPGISISNGAFEDSLPAMGGMVTDYQFNPGDVFPTPVPDPYTVGQISGRFTSPTAARGTIHIFLGAAWSGGIVCELGTFNWEASGE
jgi:hypothetical protein